MLLAAAAVSRGELFLRPLPARAPCLPLPALTATEHINQLSPFINPANESLRPSEPASNVARTPDRQQTFFVHYEIAWKMRQTEFWAGGEDISALFRAEAANKSQSQFITNLDF